MTRVLRRSTDQLLILASDGLWDVMSSQEVCSLAMEKFNAEMARGGSSKSAVKVCGCWGGVVDAGVHMDMFLSVVAVDSTHRHVQLQLKCCRCSGQVQRFRASLL